MRLFGAKCKDCGLTSNGGRAEIGAPWTETLRNLSDGLIPGERCDGFALKEGD